jgi:uncharacterized protein YcbX
MTGARIARINVTPVKSLRLLHPPEIELLPEGAREDRRFLLVDPDGRLYNGKRDTTLVRTGAVWDATSRRLALTLPGGEIVEDEVFSGAATAVEVYGRRLGGRIVEGPWAGALSDLAGRMLTLVDRDDGVWATDARPATLVSRGSLDTLDGDGRRFRMLLELDGLEAHTEDDWRNRQIRVGGALLTVGDPTPRCAVPSASPDTGVPDRDVLRELLEQRGPIDGEPCFGVYAEVIEPGIVRVGDLVEVI